MKIPMIIFIAKVVIIVRFINVIIIKFMFKA